jgi:hypothetical protein
LKLLLVLLHLLKGIYIVFVALNVDAEVGAGHSVELEDISVVLDVVTLCWVKFAVGLKATGEHLKVAFSKEDVALV